MSVQNLRKWQQQAIAATKVEWTNPNHKVLLAACPGAGKTVAGIEITRHAHRVLGATLTIVVAPTKNIKWQWQDAMSKAGFRALDDITNSDIREAFTYGTDPFEGWDVICVTYASLARDAELYAELARRYVTSLIADEVHRADEDAAFGSALSMVAACAKYRVALSGTPFNTKGGVLSMCKHFVEKLEDGTSRMRTVPTFSYNYGEAVDDVSESGARVCRPVEFIKILGAAKASYARLSSGEVYERIVDFSKKNDALEPLLEPHGDFMRKMLEEGVTALEGMKNSSRDAGMLVVTKDKRHGKHVASVLNDICLEMGHNYNIVEVYSDSAGAHEKIGKMSDYANDKTDIVVSVKMISEGVDIKRMRVGVYATNVKTEMFFSQFVGRFVRWESSQPTTQHAKIVIPAHIAILEMARNIENLIDSVELREKGSGPDTPPEKSVLLDSATKVTGDGIIYRHEETDDITAAKEFFKLDIAKGLSIDSIPYYQAAILYRNWVSSRGDQSESGATDNSADDSAGEDRKATDKEMRAALNKAILGQVRKAAGFYRDLNPGATDQDAFARVNKEINNALGVPKKLKTETADQLRARLEAATRIAELYESAYINSAFD